MTTTKKTTTSRTRKTADPKPAAKKTTTTRKPAAPKAEKIELTPTSYVHEIFSAISAERTKDKKISILQQYNENFIKSLLIWNFDASITSVLPEGEVPVQKKEDADKNPSSSIRKEWSKFYNFVKGGNDGMSKLRKETMFINMLESFHSGEAEVLCLVKDKKLQTKYNLTKELVTEAYPDIQWGGRS
jgi:hypothetical protein